MVKWQFYCAEKHKYIYINYYTPQIIYCMTLYPLTYIIILNWNGWKDTISCLESIQINNYINYHVLIIDNDSQDDSVEKIKSWVAASSQTLLKSSVQSKSIDNCYIFEEIEESISLMPLSKEITLMKSPQNLGFSEGCNLGIQYALQQMAEYIFLLNNDTSFKPDLLNHLVTVSQEADAAIVGANVLDVVGEIIPNENDKITLFSKENWQTHFFYHPKKIKPSLEYKYWETSMAAGSALLLRKDLLKQRYSEYSYFLEPNFFMYCEEIDFCLYAMIRGYKCVIARDAIVYHKVSRVSGGQGNPRTYYYCTRNRIFLANRWLKFPWKQIFHIYYVPSRLFILFMKQFFTGQNFKVAKAVVSGFVDAYRNINGKWVNH